MSEPRILSTSDGNGSIVFYLATVLPALGESAELKVSIEDAIRVHNQLYRSILNAMDQARDNGQAVTKTLYAMGALRD